MKDRAIRFMPTAVLLSIPTVLVLPAVCSGGTLYGFDLFQVFYYARGFEGREMASGHLPVWDPHTLCGFPHLAALQAATFYPLSWPAMALPPGPFWIMTAWVHLSLAGVFSFLWLRRGLRLNPWASVAGSSVFMLSGFVLAHLYAGHINHVSAYPWVAAALWRAERFLTSPTLRRWTLLALAFVMLVLSGAPQYAFITGLAFAARLIGHVLTRRQAKSALAAAAAPFLSVLLSAPQILPTLELLTEAQRAGRSDYEFLTGFSFPPENLVTLLVPTFFGDMREVLYWGRWEHGEVCGFTGIASLALAGVGLSTSRRDRYVWAALVLGGLLLALGRYTPVFRLFSALVPGASFFRGPGRYLCLMVTGLTPLVAIGVERLTQADDSRRASFFVGTTVAALGFGLLAMIFAIGSNESVFWRRILEGSDRNLGSIPGFSLASWKMARGGMEWAALGALILAVSLLANARGKLSGRASAIVIGGVLAAELLSFGTRYFQSRDISGVEWPAGLTKFLRDQPQAPFRLASVGTQSVADAGRCQIAGLDHVGGYEPLMLRRYAELMNAVHEQPADAMMVVASPNRPHPVLFMLGARFWFVPQGIIPKSPSWRRVGRSSGSELFEAEEALPRAFMVERAIVIEEREKRLGLLADPSFNPKKTVVLEKVPRFPLVQSSPGAVRLVSQASGSYLLEAESAEGGFLVLAEAYFPGWTAEVDGASSEIFRANHLIQAVHLSPGKHVVRFHYQSRFLFLGFLISLLSVAMLVGVAFAHHRLRRRHPEPTGPSEGT